MNVTLGEGNTPMIESKESQQLHYKNEAINPTGSFKDRGTALTVAKAKQKEVQKLHICSSGNAALSLSVYCQKAGIECVCHVPESTSEGKKQLMKAFGATLKEYDAIYEEIFHHIQETDLEGWNVTPGASNTSMKAYAGIAEEILETGIEPDQVIVPCGNGTNLAGIWEGFKSFGIEPKMIGVQIEGAAPIKQAIQQQKKHGAVDNPGESMAEGIIASESFNCGEAVKAIQESNGSLETVTEEEIQKGMTELVEDGIICEPTSAAAKPVADKFEGETVAVITGSGLKSYSKIKEIVLETEEKLTITK
jgi:threonine synthase